ncbi:MAG: hypothetical protein ACXW3S_11250 [Rhodoplanes sp.]
MLLERDLAGSVGSIRLGPQRLRHSNCDAPFKKNLAPAEACGARANVISRVAKNFVFK